MATLQDYAFQQARLRNLDPTFVNRLINQESRWNPQAVSPVGARGLMQIMPATGRELGLTNTGAFFDPQQNIQAGTQYLSQLSRQFGNDPYLMAAAYNAGPGRVRRLLSTYGSSPSAIYPHLPAETRNYVRKVAGPLGGFVSAAPAPSLGGVGVPAPRAVPLPSRSPFTITMPLFPSAFSSMPVSSPQTLAAPAPAFTLNDAALLDLPAFGGLSV